MWRVVRPTLGSLRPRCGRHSWALRLVATSLPPLRSSHLTFSCRTPITDLGPALTGDGLILSLPSPSSAEAPLPGPGVPENSDLGDTTALGVGALALVLTLPREQPCDPRCPLAQARPGQHTAARAGRWARELRILCAFSPMMPSRAPGTKQGADSDGDQGVHVQTGGLLSPSGSWDGQSLPLWG